MDVLKSFLRLSCLLISGCAGLLFAGQDTPRDYLASKPLLLEIRYCECPAIDLSSSHSDLLPSFLDQSEALKVGVLAEDAGFVGSSGLSMGYELSPVQDAPGKFHFEYAGQYKAGDGTNNGQGKLLFFVDQWVSLFGSSHHSQNGSGQASVAVRLIKTGAPDAGSQR